MVLMKVLAKDALIIARIKAEYTIKELSLESGVPSATISRAENGKPLSPKSARKLCKTLGREFCELFNIQLS